MTGQFKPFFFCLLLLASGSFGSVQAQTDIHPGMSGAWFDPAHAGEGFLVEILDSDRAAVYWFTYDETGHQRWFSATGAIDGHTATFDRLLQTRGPEFGARFDPEDVIYIDVGELSIEWTGCTEATANYTVNGTPGSQTLTRLSTLSGLDCETGATMPSSLSGSWFDQTHTGEGLVIEALDNGDVLVFWFSYDGDGRQAWFYGIGEQNDGIISIPTLRVTRGGRFGPDFDPAQVEQIPWGNLVAELGCQFGKFDYRSDLPVYGDGQQTLIRLTNPGNTGCVEAEAPNILLIIADDLGLDASNQYGLAEQKAVTPVLDQLAGTGLIFENAWSNPTCSPTRAGILTGKYGTRTGVLTADDDLSTEETSLQSYIHRHLPGKYADAVIGKWHLGPQPGGLNHPADMGIGHFAGMIGGGVDDYEDWTLVIDGQRGNETEYVTSKLVDLAIDWTGNQDSPWFLWLAFNAPHTPFHLPPMSLHDRNLTGTEADIEANPLPYYLAAIEAMDTEIGRLLESLDPQERENTIVIFMGDNGTPSQVVQSPFGRRKAKGSLYQGGINIPLFVSGPGVTRSGERESALVNTTDLFSTIAVLAGVNVTQVNDSESFAGLLNSTGSTERYFQYSDKFEEEETEEEWAISDGDYKLIESSTGRQELYRLSADPYEESDLVDSGNAPAEILENLQFLADQIRFGSGPAEGFDVVDTGQQTCHDDIGELIDCPARGNSLYGQDAQYQNNPPEFLNHGDGTVGDRRTGLTWQQSPDSNQDGRIDAADKMSLEAAQAYCTGLQLGGHTDWRLPDIKQLYSLIDFRGIDPSGFEGSDTSNLVPFINTSYFDFGYGDLTSGERVIDAQFASSTLYVSTTGNSGAETMFGVNFADGRIKGYGLSRQGRDTTFYVLCSRGNALYGQNDFVNNGDGTVTDRATGLMWATDDSKVGLDWAEALEWVEQQNRANYLGYSDWKLPNAKELQSLVDYSRSPASSESAAVNPLFNSSAIINEAGETDFAAYWTSTTHLNQTVNAGANGVYVNFGRSMGYVNDNWVDIHGAGAQRSDPKSGNPDEYPLGRGPQGDAIRIYNHVRLVRSTN